MKNLSLIAAFIIGIVLLIVIVNLPASYKAPENNSAEIITSELAIQTNDAGGVVVVVTPIDQSDWSFEVALNTHSIEIGEDLVKVSVLLDQSGNVYQPISWEGNPPGGHHRTGILHFGAITPSPESITLIIKQVGGIAERKFKWTIRP
jgi:hypothetical protein